MLRKVMLVLCIFFSGFALSEDRSDDLPVTLCITCRPHSCLKYFLISTEHFELLKRKPAGSFTDAIKTLQAALALPSVRVDIDQEIDLAFRQLEIPTPSECRQIDLSTLDYDGINFIFTRFNLNNLVESRHHSLVIAKWPVAPEKVSNVTFSGQLLRVVLIYCMASYAFAALGARSPGILGFMTGVWCGLFPNKCYDIFTDRPESGLK